MMRLTIEEETRSGPALRPDVVGRIEAVVIDEWRQPVERVTGALAIEASSHELALKADLPLIPGSHLMVQVGDCHAPDAESLRFEVEVIGCKKWMQGHHVRTRLVEGTMPHELLRAA